LAIRAETILKLREMIATFWRKSLATLVAGGYFHAIEAAARSFAGSGPLGK
jgi:hypothetical protein